ncbi:MFS transporter [Catenuloplanes japonicus]|uniref:MFS transporter n=1 Tax=Catenuloplanes japonicus TaxID=33876 RepID=UPI000A86A54C|nr:MFS transporter [Catenuloplanes japonicus]
MRMPGGLFALAAGGFGIGLTEFVIAGLLPQVAASFTVSEAAAGRLISGYALSVAVGAIVLTAATARRPRKQVLTGLVALFVAGNLLCAIAPGYEIMMLGRVVAALCHGSFFGIGSLVAAALVTPDRRSRAVAVMFGGLTVANVVGVPFGALIGERWGWQATFWVITGVGLVALAGILALVPPGAGDSDGAPASLRDQVRAFRSRQVWLTLAATALGYGGMFGAFSYIAYTLTEVGGFTGADVAWLLVVYGAGLAIGNLVGGRAADRHRDATVIVAFVALALTLILFGVLAAGRAASVVLMLLMGISGFAGVPGLITRVTDAAGGAALAASANVSASNVGNAVGAWLGGVVIAAGLGYTGPLYAGAVLVLLATVVMIAAARQAREPSPVGPA